MATLDDGSPFVRLEGEGGDAGFFEDLKIFLSCARVEEAFSKLSQTTVEFRCRDKSLELKKIVGKAMNLSVATADGSERKFLGRCISAKFLGVDKGFAYFTAEVRPWLWFLTRRTNSRVFQEMSVPDIITSVLGDYGFSDVLNKLESYSPREYCVQYRETDFDFLHRLMEEEGIYYFFAHDGVREEMVLADGLSAHTPVPNASSIEYHPRRSDFRRKDEDIYEWQAIESATSGEVTLIDYNFEKPKMDLSAANKIKKGEHAQTELERYDYPGHFRETDLGKKYARVKMEAEAVQHHVWKGMGNVRTLGVGHTFSLTEHPRVKDDTEFLLTKATHYVQVEEELDRDPTIPTLLDDQQDIGQNEHDPYRCVFEVIPKKEQFRAPLKTPWPEVAGVQTAVVVGPSGEEIHTDKYGRVKIQFHWDRDGKDDDTSSCWVRVMMPWTGKNWGMIHIPRIGQEVVVQFEEGDPDRPLVVGMLYNADTMPPYALPDNKTQSGIKTNTSKDGGGFNELVFEDKKSEELVRFQSERDYKQIIKNDAEITVGLEHKDKGDMSTTIHRHFKETLKTGDHTFKVESGKQDITIKKDQKTIIEDGNQVTEIGKGDQTTEIKLGDQTIKIAAGKATIEAMQSYEIKVGSSSIKLDPTGVTIKGMKVVINGEISVEAKGGVSAKVEGGATAEISSGAKTDVKSGGMTKVAGSIVMIN